MTPNKHRVTVDHIRALAVDPAAMRTPATTLVDTDDGIRLFAAESVLAEGSSARRLLLTRVDLVEDASAVGLTLAAYVKANASQIAAEINHSNI